MGVGFPETLKLNQFGSLVREAFGHTPYHVGSSLGKKTGWRDVDVRLILNDEEYAALLGNPERPQMANAKWSVLCLAFSALGREMTGLPIDFQIQQRSEANEKFGGPRSALILWDLATAPSNQQREP